MGGGSNRIDSSPYNPDLESAFSVSEPLEIHSVSLPETKKTLSALKQGLGEFFFPDDPFHQFKNQPFFRKLVIGLQFLFPIFQWMSDYNLKLLKSDIVSGLTIASLAIPQGISYAKLANLPPIIGLYSNFVPPLIYGVLGSSRDLAVGPVSIASLVMGTMLKEEVSPTKEPTIYLQLAFTATFFAGVFQASLGFLRLGFIVDFLSKPTLIGFMGGSAIIVSLQQLKGLLGISHFTNQMGFIPVMLSVFKNREEGLRRPKLFWVSAAAPLTSVILSTVIVFSFKAQNQGINTIGQLQKGVNPPSYNMLVFQGPNLVLAIKTGVISGILSLTEGIAVGRTFASIKSYKIDGNKEMMAIGIMNMTGSCASCYVTTGSFSRSAVNYNAGSQTAVSNIIMALVVLITMLFLMPLFYYTPNVILSVIIITAVISLVDYGALIHLWKVDKLDFAACLCAFFGVIFISVQMGLTIAVGISIFKILIHVTRPNIVIMGNVPGTRNYRNLGQYKNAIRVPSFIVLGIESPVYFANSMYLQERILRWIREEEERATKMNESKITCIVLDISAVTAVDTSGIDALVELKRTLTKRSLQLVLANPLASVAEKLHISEAWQKVGSESIYMSIGEAISGVSCTFKGQQSQP
ncbi:putative sulfate transporter 3.4 [Apostasia shenzhenica]|uniref:Putative sulfate transporter 3.4 n=1 Tax=Apostasia shenzhenica TaxID=1088818 RepID=A0A2H9ZU35_9ASPA|nr:putative sulfate transporter 3.4 [Apostasia shenzhenica]